MRADNLFFFSRTTEGGRAVPIPNFLIIGVAKCGTTSLYHYLDQHPEIYMCPVKEPHFLVHDDAYPKRNGPIKSVDYIHTKTLSDYLKLFDGVTDEKAIGEASTSNFTERACDQASTYMPHARLIAIFRHPIDQAYAEFLHRRRVGFEPERSFLTAYRASNWRLQHNWATHLCYKSRAYVPILQYWLSRFPREQFRFYLTEDLQTDASSLMQDVFRFLEVDDSFKPDVSARHNAAFSVRSRRLSHFYHTYSRTNPIRVFLRTVVPLNLKVRLKKRVDQWNRVPVEPVDPEIHSELTKELRDDILRLQSLIGRDLSHWLETA